MCSMTKLPHSTFWSRVTCPNAVRGRWLRCLRGVRCVASNRVLRCCHGTCQKLAHLYAAHTLQVFLPTLQVFLPTTRLA